MHNLGVLSTLYLMMTNAFHDEISSAVSKSDNPLFLEAMEKVLVARRGVDTLLDGEEPVNGHHDTRDVDHPEADPHAHPLLVAGQVDSTHPMLDPTTKIRADQHEIEDMSSKPHGSDLSEPRRLDPDRGKLIWTPPPGETKSKLIDVDLARVGSVRRDTTAVREGDNSRRHPVSATGQPVPTRTSSRPGFEVFLPLASDQEPVPMARRTHQSLGPFHPIEPSLHHEPKPHDAFGVAREVTDGLIRGLDGRQTIRVHTPDPVTPEMGSADPVRETTLETVIAAVDESSYEITRWERAQPLDTSSTPTSFRGQLTEAFRDALQSMVRGVEKDLQGEISGLRIRLHPENLGDLGLRIAVEKGALNAHFSAQSEQVRALIEAALPELKEYLNQQGILVDDLSVGVGDQGRDPSSQDNRTWGRSGEDTSDARPGQSGNDAETVALFDEDENTEVSPGRVDVLV